MLSVIPNTLTYCRNLRRIMKDELEGIWKEAVIRN